MGFRLVGPVSKSRRTDAEGHREYRVKYKVETDTPSRDGPQRVDFCAGLPLPGAPYVLDNDLDIWAWCREDETITPAVETEPSKVWFVEKLFSTKPPDKSRCNTTKVEDPLLEPFKISGNFSKYTEEAAFNRFGYPITYSSFEPIRGRAVEFDNNRPTVRIESNVSHLNWPLCAALVDCVNALPMWGMARRCVKLANVSWERKYWGYCSVYYSRILEFEADYNTWDRNVADESHLCLRGHWNTNGHWQLDLIGGQLPNPGNPAHYMVYPDFQGNPKRGFLNGAGLPAGACIDLPGGLSVFTGYLLSLSDTHVPGDVTNQTLWARLVDNPQNPPTWNGSGYVTYSKGRLVKLIDPDSDPPVTNYYLQTNPAGSGSGPSSSPLVNLDWRFLGNNIPDLYRGGYAPESSLEYGLYDSVYASITTESPGTGTVPCVPTGFGQIHIERYREQDLFLLGVPAAF